MWLGGYQERERDHVSLCPDALECNGLKYLCAVGLRAWNEHSYIDGTEG
jgi:hypothetical protein